MVNARTRDGLLSTRSFVGAREGSLSITGLCEQKEEMLVVHYIAYQPFALAFSVQLLRKIGEMTPII